MAFITQFYTWSTGNTITAARMNGNVSNLINGLDDGTKDINVGTIQIGGTEVISSSRTATVTGITTSGDVSSTTAIDWDLLDNNASALSFDTTGKTGILNIVTTDGSEGVSMSGTLSVTGNITASSGIVLATGQGLKTSTSAGNTLLLQAYDVDGGSYTTFATLTANNTPTMSIASSVTATTQSQGDNSTKLATTAYVDAAVLAEDYWTRTSTTVTLKNSGDTLKLNTNEKIEFRDSDIYIQSGADGRLDITADTAIDINGTLDFGTNTITDGTFTGNWDFGTGNVTTGGILKIDVDGTAENAAGSLTLGAGNDAGIFFDGTNLVIITNGAGASGIILDSEDDTVEIKGSGTLQATFDTGGLNLVTGDTYEINGATVISATALGSGVTGSSLTSVGTLTSLTVSGDITADTSTLKVDSSNNRVGIGTATPSYRLEVSGSEGLNITGSNSRLYLEGQRTLEDVSSGTRLDVAESYTGMFFRATNSYFGESASPNETRTINQTMISESGYYRSEVYSATTTHAPVIELMKSTGTTAGTPAATGNGDVLGSVEFKGVNSSNAEAYGGSITSVQDGASGTYAPTNMKFSTYSTSSENSNQLVLHNDGRIGVGTDTPDAIIDVEFSTAGSVVQQIINHTDNTSGSSHAILSLVTGGASGGDPKMYLRNGVTDWAIGVDNSDSDKFKISNNTALQTSTYLTVDTSGNIGIGNDSPSRLVHLLSTSAVLEIEASGDNNARLILDAGANSDARIELEDDNSTKWAFGMDSTDSNAFVLSNSGGLGTSNRFKVETNGTVHFGTHSSIASETVTGYITISDIGGTTRKIAVVS